MTTITVWLNGQQIECQSQQCLTQLLEVFAIPTVGAAIAINQSIVTRSEWSTTILTTGDHIALFQVIAGG